MSTLPANVPFPLAPEKNMPVAEATKNTPSNNQKYTQKSADRREEMQR
jgi:hypothetical protein